MADESRSLSALAPTIDIHGARVLVGTCSWTDATLIKETDWYPRRSMSAAERLAHYASQFPLVETDSTYYFPPTPELAASWVERTPPGFTMNVKAYSLLTGHPTFPHSLWPDLQSEVGFEHRDKRRLYAKHLTIEALDEVWERFRHALLPLQSAGKLGAVLLQYPRWFGPKESNREQLRSAREKLPDFPLCIEFRNGRWLEGDECERTFEFLESQDLAFVCVDEPAGFPSSVPPVVAATSELAVVRFHGRNSQTWEQDTPTAALRFRYLYDRDELEEWVPKIGELAESAKEVHVLLNNCYRDQAVINGAQLAALLRGEEPSENNEELQRPSPEPRQERLELESE